MSPQEPNNDLPLDELQRLIRRPSTAFKATLHRRIERRVLVRDLSVMGWELSKLVLSEALSLCADWLRGPKRSSGGPS